MDGWIDWIEEEGEGKEERERESQERAGEDGFSWKKRRSFLARAKREANL